MILLPFIWQRCKKKKKEWDIRKLMPYHQETDLFLKDHSAVKNTFIYFKKECTRNMSVLI